MIVCVISRVKVRVKLKFAFLNFTWFVLMIFPRVLTRFHLFYLFSYLRFIGRDITHQSKKISSHFNVNTLAKTLRR